MNEIIQKIANYRLIPVIKLNDAKNAAPLARALEAGGLPLAEITFRTDAAEQSIKNVKRDCPSVLLGAGTVTKVEQAQRALDAGAAFIVMPGISDRVIEYCLKEDVPVLAGVCTPSEVMHVMEYGLNVVKFFPAGQYGGLETIKALSAPFPDVRFVPTGGVSEKNILEYLSFPKILACGGSWMVPEKTVDAGDFDEIESLVSRAVALVSGT